MSLKNKIKNCIPKFIKLKYHAVLSLMARLIFYKNFKNVKVIGITGTDGKTTTSFMLNSILQKANKKVALCNGEVIQIIDDKKANHTDNTTPNPFVLHRFLKKAINYGCEYIVIEVTSWALTQSRLNGVYFDMAIFTNFNHEHTDLHGSLEEYLKAKGELFNGLMKTKKKYNKNTTSILNIDDDKFKFFNNFFADNKVTYAIINGSVNKAENLNYYPDNTTFDLLINNNKTQIKLGLPGHHNVYNALAAISAASVFNIDLSDIKKGLEKVYVPGRFNYVESGQPFKVIVDFAHTPQAFESLFKAVRKIYPKSNLIAVFGSAGGRDHKKRAIQGKIAEKWLDYFVLTSDDPRNENPKIIADQIVKFVSDSTKYEFIKDRKKAFKKAFEIAHENDIVMLLSMGAYEYMYVKDGKVKWNDGKKAKEVLSQMGYNL